MSHFIDSETVPLKNVSRTPEGYLVADSFAVRAGIQRYLGSEVGRPDLQFVDIYRPPEEVFSKASVATFAHAPITVDHPPGGVDASNWREKAVGEVSTEAMRDGERLRLQLIIKDAEAAKLSKRQLSAGYTCQIDWSAPGKTPAGEDYLGIQRNIRINHLALVEKGRAGNCQIGDSAWGVIPVSDGGAAPQNTKEVHMDIKTLVLGDAAVKVVAEDESKVTAFVAKFADATNQVQTLTGENTALKQQLADAQMTPAKLQQLVADRAITAAAYKTMTGTDAPADMADADLRRAAVVAKLGDSAKAMSDEAISGAFAAFTAQPAAPTPDPLKTGIKHQDTALSDADMTALFASAGVPMKKEA